MTKLKSDQKKTDKSNEPEKGYAGTDDYQTGKVQSDPSQATDEQLREDRERQRDAQ